MIINPRGTSGSGKSFLINRLREQYGRNVRFYSNQDSDLFQYAGPYRLEKPRKQPLFYVMEREGGPSAVLLGHYESACGGCDTIASLDTIFGLAREFAQEGMDVIFEGLLVSAEHRRSLALFSDYEHRILRLSTSMDDCVASVQSRRDARGDDRPLNPKNTLLKDKAVASTCRKLKEAGLNMLEVDRNAALQEALDALGFQA